LTVIAAVAWMPAALAQDPGQPAPPPAEGYPPDAAQPAVPPPAPVETPPPPPPRARVVQATPAPEAPPSEGENDLDPDKRPVGIGYAGVSQIPLGGATASITAPAIGARIWTSPKLGIDIALGFGWADGSTETGGVSTDLNAAYGFILQGGLPVAVANHKHVSFQFIPYTLFAYGATKTGAGPLGTATEFTGTRFDLGVRTGLEVFFGFIGLPQLSLSGTVGAAFSLRSVSSDAGGTFGKMSATTYGISTTVQSNPWDIFTGNVAARYYF
jgi:hypothetical protein